MHGGILYRRDCLYTYPNGDQNSSNIIALLMHCSQILQNWFKWHIMHITRYFIHNNHA